METEDQGPKYHVRPGTGPECRPNRSHVIFFNRFGQTSESFRRLSGSRRGPESVEGDFEALGFLVRLLRSRVFHCVNRGSLRYLRRLVVVFDAE